MSAVQDYILQHVDVFDLCEHYGLYSGPRTETFIICPFHSEDTPSARLYQDGLLFCFGENKMYDPVSFVMHQEDLPYKKALTWLQENYGFTIPDSIFKQELEPSEKDALRDKVMAYKYTLPFKTYLNLWRLYDADSLTESILNDILFKSEVF